jgi:hypothetical protein
MPSIQKLKEANLEPLLNVIGDTASALTCSEIAKSCSHQAVNPNPISASFCAMCALSD